MTVVGFNGTQALRQQTDLGPGGGSGEMEKTGYRWGRQTGEQEINCH